MEYCVHYQVNIFKRWPYKNRKNRHDHKENIDNAHVFSVIRNMTIMQKITLYFYFYFSS